MNFVQTLLAGVFGALISAALVTSYLEFLVLIIRSPKRISDE